MIPYEIIDPFFKESCRDSGLFLIYDVAHNIAKMERYEGMGKGDYCAAVTVGRDQGMRERREDA